MNGGFLNEINESDHSLAAEGIAAAARTGKEGHKEKFGNLCWPLQCQRAAPVLFPNRQQIILRIAAAEILRLLLALLRLRHFGHALA